MGDGEGGNVALGNRWGRVRRGVRFGEEQGWVG